jgi:hypothetical protein
MNLLEDSDLQFLLKFGFIKKDTDLDTADAIFWKIQRDAIIFQRSFDLPSDRPEFPAIVAEDAHEQVISRMAPKELRELKDRIAAR